MFPPVVTAGSSVCCLVAWRGSEGRWWTAAVDVVSCVTIKCFVMSDVNRVSPHALPFFFELGGDLWSRQWRCPDMPLADVPLVLWGEADTDGVTQSTDGPVTSCWWSKPVKKTVSFITTTTTPRLLSPVPHWQHVPPHGHPHTCGLWGGSLWASQVRGRGGHRERLEVPLDLRCRPQ